MKNFKQIWLIGLGGLGFGFLISLIFGLFGVEIPQFMMIFIIILGGGGSYFFLKNNPKYKE